MFIIVNLNHSANNCNFAQALDDLSPFFFTSICFFSVLMVEVEGNMHENKYIFAFVKCAPIFLLNLRSCFLKSALNTLIHHKSGHYRKFVLIGLIFSSIGDACLVWEEDCFIHGMLAFGIAHIFYMAAFGFSPLKPALLDPICGYCSLHPHAPPCGNRR